MTALPALGGTQPLADGAVFTSAGFAPLNTTNGTPFLVGRFAPGTNQTRAQRKIAELPSIATPTRATVAVEINRLRQINWFPATLAALLAELALLAVGHALVTAVRRRRRDLALLKTLGFNRRQVAPPSPGKPPPSPPSGSSSASPPASSSATSSGTTSPTDSASHPRHHTSPRDRPHHPRRPPPRQPRSPTSQHATPPEHDPPLRYAPSSRPVAHPCSGMRSRALAIMPAGFPYTATITRPAR